MSADEPITSLPDAVAALGALPVPVGPEPLSAGRLAEIAARAGIATEGPWRVVEGHEIHQGAEFGDFAVYVAQTDPDCGCVQSVADAEFIAHAREDVPALLADNDRLRARVAELEAELAVANGVLDDAAQARRDGAACPCPSVDRLHQVGCPEDGVPAAAREPEGEFHPWLHHENRVPHDLPQTGGDGRG